MNDAINGAMELMGALFLLNNCRMLYTHRRVQGVSVSATAFFTTWGLWNLYFYPANGLWLSFAGGLCLASVNVAWVAMAIFYERRSGNHSPRMLRELRPLDMSVSPTHF